MTARPKPKLTREQLMDAAAAKTYAGRRELAADPARGV
jgi:hypothetical protein